jgi:hypothetical protein
MARRTARNQKPQSPAPFLGRWKLVNDRGIASSYLTVTESGAEREHAPHSPCTWKVVDREMRFKWEDGFRDILRLGDNSTMTFLSLGQMASRWDGPPIFSLQAIRMDPPDPIPDVSTGRKDPLSQTDFPTIAEATRQLVRALETIRPGEPAPDNLDQAKRGLLSALMPRGVKDWDGGDTDITESALGMAVKAELKKLRRFLLDRPIMTRARHELEETVTYLKTVLRALAAEQLGHRGEPGRRPKYKRSVDLALKLLRETGANNITKGICNRCLAAYPDEFPDHRPGDFRALKRAVRKRQSREAP